MKQQKPQKQGLMRTRDGTRTGVVSPTRAVLSIAKIEIFFIFVIPKQQKNDKKRNFAPLVWCGKAKAPERFCWRRTPKPRGL